MELIPLSQRVASINIWAHSKPTERKMFSDNIQIHIKESKPTPQLKVTDGRPWEVPGLQCYSNSTWQAPEKPNMAWQILLRGLLEGVHSSCKSYLVGSPGFTGQGFILIFKTSCFKVCLHFGLLSFLIFELTFQHS